jgi:hypothetical protein
LQKSLQKPYFLYLHSEFGAAFWAFDAVFTLYALQPQLRLAGRAFHIDVSFSVFETVLYAHKELFYFFPDRKEGFVFAKPRLDLTRKHPVDRKRHYDELDYIYDERAGENVDERKRDRGDYERRVELVGAVAPVHKLT